MTYLVVFSFDICSHLEKKLPYTQSISPNREPSLDPSTYHPVDFRISRTNSLKRPSILQRSEPELPVESVKLEVQDGSPQALSPEEEEIFNSRLSKIWGGIKAFERTAEWKAIISRETTDVWLSRIAEHIPTNVKLILASRHPPPDELKLLAWSSTTDARVLTWCSEVRGKQESGEKTVYVYVGSTSNHPGGLIFRKRYMLSPSVEPHDEALKRKIKNLGLSSRGQFGTLFIVSFENNFDGDVLNVRALSILTRLLLMIWLGAVNGELKSKTKDLVPWKLGKIQYIGLATDNPLATDINKSSGRKKSGERRVQRRVKRKSEKKSLKRVQG